MELARNLDEQEKMRATRQSMYDTWYKKVLDLGWIFNSKLNLLYEKLKVSKKKYLKDQFYRELCFSEADDIKEIKRKASNLRNDLSKLNAKKEHRSFRYELIEKIEQKEDELKVLDREASSALSEYLKYKNNQSIIFEDTVSKNYLDFVSNHYKLDIENCFLGVEQYTKTSNDFEFMYPTIGFLFVGFCGFFKQTPEIKTWCGRFIPNYLRIFQCSNGHIMDFHDEDEDFFPYFDFGFESFVDEKLFLEVFEIMKKDKFILKTLETLVKEQNLFWTSHPEKVFGDTIREELKNDKNYICLISSRCRDYVRFKKTSNI